MDGRLEHANVTVVSIDRAVEFLTIAFPRFKIRGGGDMQGEGWTGKWLHLGTDTDYVAIQETTETALLERDATNHTGINHVGFEVDSVDDILQRMQAAGYEGSMAEVHRFCKRLYVKDNDGITWEFIEYMSDDPAKRNEYS